MDQSHISVNLYLYVREKVTARARQLFLFFFLIPPFLFPKHRMKEFTIKMVTEHCFPHRNPVAPTGDEHRLPGAPVPSPSEPPLPSTSGVQPDLAPLAAARAEGAALAPQRYTAPPLKIRVPFLRVRGKDPPGHVGAARGPPRSRTESGGARRKRRWAASAPSARDSPPAPGGDKPPAPASLPRGSLRRPPLPRGLPRHPPRSAGPPPRPKAGGPGRALPPREASPQSPRNSPARAAGGPSRLRRSAPPAPPHASCPENVHPRSGAPSLPRVPPPLRLRGGHALPPPSPSSGSSHPPSPPRAI